jgi:hypothetical protein
LYDSLVDDLPLGLLALTQISSSALLPVINKASLGDLGNNSEMNIASGQCLFAQVPTSMHMHTQGMAWFLLPLWTMRAGIGTTK